MPREDAPLDVARGLAPWVIAVGLHLAVASTLYVAEHPRVIPASVTPAPIAEIDVAYDSAVAAPEAPQLESAPTPAVSTALVAAIAATTTPAPKADGNAILAADQGAAATWTFRPTASADVRLGTLGAMAVAGEQHEAPRPSTTRPASTTGGLSETLAAKDVQLGLGHGGPVRRAVDDAARTPDAPTFGTATFAITLREDGEVSVQLASASSERPGWEALRVAIHDAVAAAPKRIAAHGKGVRVVVQVEASEQFPGGGKPTPEKQQGAAVSGSIGAIHETKEHIDIELPHAELVYRTRGCVAGASVNPGGISITAGCEPGVAMRVVSTKILAEQPL